MEDITYTKGLYTATASVKEVGPDTWQGAVTLSRDKGDENADQETTQRCQFTIDQRSHDRQHEQGSEPREQSAEDVENAQQRAHRAFLGLGVE